MAEFVETIIEAVLKPIALWCECSYSEQCFDPNFYLERRLILGYASPSRQTVPQFHVFSDHAPMPAFQLETPPSTTSTSTASEATSSSASGTTSTASPTASIRRLFPSLVLRL